jgi:hypothetical protein
MNENNPHPGNDEEMPSKLEMLSFDAGTLAGLLEALEVLNERARGPDCGLSRQARDSIGPTLLVAIEKAWELASDLDALKPKESLQ